MCNLSMDLVLYFDYDKVGGKNQQLYVTLIFDTPSTSIYFQRHPSRVFEPESFTYCCILLDD
jgi:hypothetical protein